MVSESFNQHIYIGSKCIYCNSNEYDVDLYEEDEKSWCVNREETLIYTTSSSEISSNSNYDFSES